jgi:hypothetical protein
MSFTSIRDTFGIGRIFFATACFAAVLLSGVSVADAQTRIEAGTLRCTMAPAIGAIVGSRRRMTCRFDSSSNRESEQYSGTITRFGLDVGAVAGGVMSWRVLTRTRAAGRGAIAGTYFGASADASLGVGAGAKVLIGGSRRSTMLQPVAGVGIIGVNLAAGVTGLTLRYSR